MWFCVLMDFVEQHWREPDEGIWEVRGPRRHFTHSKVMAWVAVDRAVKAVEQHGMKGPLDQVAGAARYDTCRRLPLRLSARSQCLRPVLRRRHARCVSADDAVGGISASAGSANRWHDRGDPARSGG